MQNEPMVDEYKIVTEKHAANRAPFKTRSARWYISIAIFILLILLSAFFIFCSKKVGVLLTYMYRYIISYTKKTSFLIIEFLGTFKLES